MRVKFDRKQKAMNLIKFLGKFPDEQSCINHFRTAKERQGIICEQCGSIVHYWLKNKLMHECKGCRRRVSIRSGTHLVHTKLTFHYWYLALHLMTATKKGFSALEIRRQIGHKRYEPIFKMMHKIRKAMGSRDNKYLLKDMIEIDDAYIETCTDALEKGKLKRGKGSQRQTKATVMAESIVLEDLKNGIIQKQCRYFKMKVNPSEKAEQMKALIKAHVSEKAVVFSDNSKAYVNVHQVVEAHHIENSQRSFHTENLKWVHVAISNLKRNLLGLHHSINQYYLQFYMDEFCYKLNRRYLGEKLFDRGILAIIAT